MKVDRQTAADHRSAMLDAATRLFRRGGFDGVGVADVARAAGLTHGAFYGHFASKQDLAAESCRLSLRRGADHWRILAGAALAEGRDPLDAVVGDYLSRDHVDRPDGGCTLAALGAEAARTAPLRPAMAEGAEALAAVIAEILSASHPQATQDAIDRVALAILAALQGGLVLARALSDDPARVAAVLEGAGALAGRAAADL